MQKNLNPDTVEALTAESGALPAGAMPKVGTLSETGEKKTS